MIGPWPVTSTCSAVTSLISVAVRLAPAARVRRPVAPARWNSVRSPRVHERSAAISRAVSGVTGSESRAARGAAG